MEEDREDIERRIAEAKRSLSSRLAELGDRLDRTRRTLSLRQKMEEHSWLILGAAAFAGLLLGRRGSRSAALEAANVRPSRGLLSAAAHQIVRSLITTAAASVAASFVKQQMEEGEVSDRIVDPDHRTTGVRIYPVD
jgi:hypothetical protein